MRTTASPVYRCDSGNCKGVYRSPQTGILRVPWATYSFRPSITSYTARTGNTPPFFLTRTVKSGVATFSCSLSGPLPLPSMPWQLAHDVTNSDLPKSAFCGQAAVSSPKARLASISHFTPIFAIRHPLISIWFGHHHHKKQQNRRALAKLLGAHYR